MGRQAPPHCAVFRMYALSRRAVQNFLQCGRFNALLRAGWGEGDYWRAGRVGRFGVGRRHRGQPLYSKGVLEREVVEDHDRRQTNLMRWQLAAAVSTRQLAEAARGAPFAVASVTAAAAFCEVDGYHMYRRGRGPR